MPFNIPEILYRGDSDKHGDRMLKQTIKQNLLCTNMINGGIGSDIFTKPLIELVKIHINPGWGKTHFLSFSELEAKALGFGSHEIQGEYSPFYDDTASWSFALLKFYPLKLDYTFIEEGVYEGLYPNGYRIRLINTVTYLKANIHLNTASQLKNAKRDKEWLILPATPVQLNFNRIEYSAKLDMDDIIVYELFEML